MALWLLLVLFLIRLASPNLFSLHFFFFSLPHKKQHKISYQLVDFHCRFCCFLLSLLFTLLIIVINGLYTTRHELHNHFHVEALFCVSLKVFHVFQLQVWVHEIILLTSSIYLHIFLMTRWRKIFLFIFFSLSHILRWIYKFLILMIEIVWFYVCEKKSECTNEIEIEWSGYLFQWLKNRFSTFFHPQFHLLDRQFSAILKIQFYGVFHFST